MRQKTNRTGGLAKAIAAADDSISELAIRIGVTPQAVSSWKQVPVGRVADVERVTGVPRHELRPDVFGHWPGGKKVARPKLPRSQLVAA